MAKPLSEGTKHDQEKVRYDLLSPLFLLGVSEVLTFGAEKYAEYNWAKGINYNRLVRAAIGHILDFWKGEDLDPESGLPHLWHAGCCLMFLTHYTQVPERYEEYDNRPQIY